MVNSISGLVSVMKKRNSSIDITVVAPVFQHWELAFFLFDALDKQIFEKERWECIVVDNGSDDLPDSSELPSFVTLLHCEKPGSYAARNLGLKHARGRLIVFTDADCRPVNDWLSQLWDAYENGSVEKLIAGGVEVKKFDSGKPNSVELYDMAMGLPQARYVKRGYAVTANLAVYREAFSTVGQFDDARFSGGDAEFCRRASQKGVGLHYVPSALVYHPARSEMTELVTKLKRVKGGQICSGSFSRRLKFFVRTFVPPVWAFWFAVKKDGLSFSEKMVVCSVQSRLWIVEMCEVVRLVLGKQPERR